MANQTLSSSRATTKTSARPEASAVRTRAWLVTEEDGVTYRQPVASDESVLNVQRDLISHLSEQPLPDAWLKTLRDYCDQRLAMRAEVRASGGVSIPRTDGKGFHATDGKGFPVVVESSRG